MKKNKLFFISILINLLIIQAFKGCSNFSTINSSKSNIELEDSIRFSNPDSIKFSNSDHKNNIPIVKLNLGFYGKKYFIIDTGATLSIIDSNWLYNHKELIKYVRENDFIRLQSFSEKTSSSASYTIELPINGVVQRFIMLDIKTLRENVKFSGYDIIGIMGSDFLSKHKYIIDYNRRCIYKSTIDSLDKPK